MRIRRLHTGDIGSAPELARTYTQPFRVYTAKTFPGKSAMIRTKALADGANATGMSTSTALSKTLARQGARNFDQQYVHG